MPSYTYQNVKGDGNGVEYFVIDKGDGQYTLRMTSVENGKSTESEVSGTMATLSPGAAAIVSKVMREGSKNPY